MTASRFVVGIDLGTTNSALAYYDTGLGDKAALTHLKIPQVVAPGVVEERPLLPSFLYLPGKAPENGRRVSPLEAGVYYLKHFVDAWNYLIAKDVTEHRLETQDIIL